MQPALGAMAAIAARCDPCSRCAPAPAARTARGLQANTCGNRLEPLKGDRAGRHSIRVNEQYRVTFRWEDGHAYEVRVEDYHCEIRSGSGPQSRPARFSWRST